MENDRDQPLRGLMRTETGVHRARTYLIQNVLTTGTAGPIPPVRQLASCARVSPVTMLKALHLLMAEGYLAPSRHKRFRPALPSFPRSLNGRERLHTCAWQRTASAIAGDLLQGIFPPGKPLPSRKQLQTRYGVHSQTLRKALDSLTAQGLIRCCGRYCAPPNVRVPHQSLSLVAVLPYDKDGRPLTIFGGEYVRLLEQKCASLRMGLVLKTYRWDGRSAGMPDEPGSILIPGSDDIAGYLYMAPASECGRNSVVRQLAGMGKPVAVLDEEGNWLPPLRKSPKAGVRLFSMGVSREPAREVGHYLLSLGHRWIAYISPFHGSVWSRRRAQGIMDLLQGIFPKQCTFHVLGLESFAGQEDYLEWGRTNARVGQLHRLHRRWSSGIPDEFARLAAPILEEAAQAVACQGEIERRMTPILHQALTETSATAWVMADDYCAAIALRFLARNGIRVPQDISVVSFDDSPVAVQSRLTSYNFNLSAIVDAMLDHILRRKTLPGAGGMPTYIRGFVVERGSACCVQKKAGGKDPGGCRRAAFRPIAALAIMVAHIYGLPVDMDPVLELSRNYDLRIIEDAAEAHGQTYKGRPCGSFGDVSTFSFYPNKLVTTGEGGMIVTDDPVIADRCKGLKNLFEDEEISAIRIAEPTMHPRENVVDVNYRVILRNRKSDQVEEVRETHRMRYFFSAELELMLEMAGLDLLGSEEWLTSKTPGFDTWGVVFAARKKPELPK